MNSWGIFFFSIETANSGQLITAITAKDLDSGKFGDQGIRYSLSGTGANLFHVDNITGAITVGSCPPPHMENHTQRKRRQVLESDSENENDAKNVNLTLVGETGVIAPNTDMTDSAFYKIVNSHDDELATTIADDYVVSQTTEQTSVERAKPGVAPCLDYETQPVYFLSYKVSTRFFFISILCLHNHIVSNCVLFLL